MVGKLLSKKWSKNSDKIKLMIMYGLILESHFKGHLETV